MLTDAEILLHFLNDAGPQKYKANVSVLVALALGQVLLETLEFCYILWASLCAFEWKDKIKILFKNK